jgi:hypothetical protein
MRVCSLFEAWPIPAVLQARCSSEGALADAVAHHVDEVAEEWLLEHFGPVCVLERCRVNLVSVGFDRLENRLDARRVAVLVDLGVEAEHREHELFAVADVRTIVVAAAAAREVSLEHLHRLNELVCDAAWRHLLQLTLIIVRIVHLVHPIASPKRHDLCTTPAPLKIGVSVARPFCVDVRN